MEEKPSIDLSLAPAERGTWGRPMAIVLLWHVFELLLVTNPWQLSSRVRVWALRVFGAKIGEGVIYRHRTRVKFPWKLVIGDRCWIGEGVWIHNQDFVRIGDDVVISQEAFLTTGSHAVRRDMALITKPIHISNGAWVTARCVVLGGANVGVNAVISPLQVVSGSIPANVIVDRDGSQRKRFD
jgi:putative colanic acid biosynthesis acetyltransferase WcaF